MSMTTSNRKSSDSHFYQIKIAGEIRENWSDWLNGIQVSFPKGEDEPQVTVLTVKVADQAALRGLLCRLWDLNLTIFSIFRLEGNAGAKEVQK